MITFLLMMFASVAQAADTRLAGIPTSELAPLGLGAPDFTIGDDTWRAPAPGGWVLHAWSPDEASAQRGLLFAVGSVQRALPAIVIAGADEARGDDGMVIARRGNVVVTVRGDHAPELVVRVLAAEVAEPATVWIAPAQPMAPDAARDAFGRRSGE